VDVLTGWSGGGGVVTRLNILRCTIDNGINARHAQIESTTTDPSSHSPPAPIRRRWRWRIFSGHAKSIIHSRHIYSRRSFGIEQSSISHEHTHRQQLHNQPNNNSNNIRTTNNQPPIPPLHSRSTRIICILAHPLHHLDHGGMEHFKMERAERCTILGDGHHVPYVVRGEFERAGWRQRWCGAGACVGRGSVGIGQRWCRRSGRQWRFQRGLCIGRWIGSEILIGIDAAAPCDHDCGIDIQLYSTIAKLWVAIVHGFGAFGGSPLGHGASQQGSVGVCCEPNTSIAQQPQ